MTTPKPQVWIYRFRRDDGTTREFPVRLEPRSMKAMPQTRPSYPEWTRLSFCQCSNCPWKEAAHPRCPVAESMLAVTEAFKDASSTESVRVEIAGPLRTFSKTTSLAEGVSALLGVLMPSSGCPVLGRFRPNVLTHLPFANVEETIFRTTAMYLLGQLFIARRGGRADWDLKSLPAMLDATHAVNQNMVLRLRQACLKDANLNALIRLDDLASLTANAAKRITARLGDLEELFDAYLPSAPV
ncbi:MAG: hypothetical protein WC881_02305 [Elusimicrobiota bacterium]|jgi:hypothetical protein